MLPIKCGHMIHNNQYNSDSEIFVNIVTTKYVVCIILIYKYNK